MRLCKSARANIWLLAALAAIAAHPAQAGPVYDAAADFEAGWTAGNNPNGVWSYGYSAGIGLPVSPLYDQTAQGIYNGANAQFWLSSSVDIGGSPAAEYNNGPAFNDGNVDFLANEFLLVAGLGGQTSDLVFTAPAAGDYSIVSSFRGAQNGIGTLVGVVINGSTVFSDSVDSVGVVEPFATSVSLAAGDTVIFAVAPGSGTQNTGVSATITANPSPVPEPTSFALIGAGLLGLGLAVRRKRL